MDDGAHYKTQDQTGKPSELDKDSIIQSQNQ